MRTNTGQILYIPRVGQRANLQHPLMRGCVGWWPLTDGAGGIAKDITANANDATRSTGLWELGKLGMAANIGAFSHPFDAGDVDVSAGKGITISSWAHPDALTNSRIVSKDQGGSDRDWFIKVVDAGGTVRAGAWSDGGTLTTVDSTASISVGTWSHLTMTWDNADLKVYIDGVEDATKPFSNTGPRNTAAQAALGARTPSTGSSEKFNGEIQNIRVWDRALSSSEVLELYTNPWAGLSMPSATRYFFLSSPSPTINPFSRIITSSTILNKSGKTVIRRGA